MKAEDYTYLCTCEGGCREEFDTEAEAMEWVKDHLENHTGNWVDVVQAKAVFYYDPLDPTMPNPER